MKTKAPDVQWQHQKEFEELKTAIGDLYVENAVLKKRTSSVGGPDRDMIFINDLSQLSGR